ncbi:MAG: hypothetical protein ACM3JQ_02750, partial [Candidatus Eiseniibacteriota bacterium]
HYAHLITRLKDDMGIGSRRSFDPDLLGPSDEKSSREKKMSLYKSQINQVAANQEKTCDYQEKTCDYEALNAAWAIVNERSKVIPYPSEDLYKNVGQLGSRSNKNGYDEAESNLGGTSGAPVCPAIESSPGNRRRRKSKGNRNGNFPVHEAIAPDPPTWSPSSEQNKDMDAIHIDRTDGSCTYIQGPDMTREEFRPEQEKPLSLLQEQNLVGLIT